MGSIQNTARRELRELRDQGLMAPYRSRIAQALVLARRRAGLVIVSAHVGPNWGSPSRAMQMLAHELLDMGADLYWGHSNHTPPRDRAP